MSSSSKMNGKIKPGGDPRDRYEMQTKIGKGAYGYVCKALDKHTNTLVAIKIINLEDAGDEVEDVHQEISVMSNISCPQLTKYFASYVYGENLWIIMEYLEAGSLLDLIKDCGPLSEPFVAYIMKELLSALAYLHSERKIHRDVKAGNILVAADGSVKLADFGVTGQLTDSIDKRQTKIGTPFWMAPEVISQSAYDGCADVWSAGITAIELCKGAPPYANRIHPFQAILLIPKNPPPVLEGAFSEEFKDFVACCLVKAPAARPSAATLLRHPFITRVEGVPPAWKAFIYNKVEELRNRSTLMSVDDSAGDLGQGGVEAGGTCGNGDWNFTARTGMSYSNSGPNSRSHSRSNSHLGSFSQASQGSLAPEGVASSLSGASSVPVSNAPSMASRSHSKTFGDISIPVPASRATLEGFHSSSSDVENSDDDLLSDTEVTPDGVTPNSGRAKSSFFGPGSGFDGENYEGISFPSTYPSKARNVPALTPVSVTAGTPPVKLTSPGALGIKSAAVKSLLQSPENSLSPRSVNSGAPPRPKSITISNDANPMSLRSASMEWGAAPGDLQRTMSKQEDRITNLQEELQALRAENSLLKTIAAPYLHSLEVLARHKEAAKQHAHSAKTHSHAHGHAHAHGHGAPTLGTALTAMDSFTSISASIQQIVYGDDADAEALQAKSDELVSFLTALTAQVPEDASQACKAIVRPVLNQLRHRVHAHAQGRRLASESKRSLRLSHTDELSDTANSILSVLTVALAALDTTDPNNPLQKAQNEAKAAAAAAKAHEEEIDLSAPTPKAVHHSARMLNSRSEDSAQSQHSAPGDSEAESPSHIDGVGCTDLLALLTAYLEEDLRRPDHTASASPTHDATRRK